MPKPSIFIDGGGVFDDIPLKGDPRIRFRPTGNPVEDITVSVVPGGLLVRGFRNPLVILPDAANSIIVRTESPS